MKSNWDDDTIAAISTPIGVGGLAVIRISGDQAIQILKKVFVGKKRIEDFIPWRVYSGHIIDQNEIVDEVLITIFKKPNSYTKEDMIEISCHGGIYVTKKILALVINNNARIAEPGEFTKRAFLNGRIDLSKAEAVAEIIYAKTKTSHQSSIYHLTGGLHQKIEELRSELLGICSQLELEIDFSEENLAPISHQAIVTKLKQIRSYLNQLIASYEKGKIIKNGVKCVIIGRPNVGKSSLFNTLLREDRAIVTDIPGTTRDPLEAELDIRGLLFRVIDTAGLTTTDNIAEQQGIIRTHKHLDDSEIIIHIFDGSEQLNQDDNTIIQKILKKSHQGRMKIIGVINKIDLNRKIDLKDIIYLKKGFPTVEISTKELIGIDKLENVMYRSAFLNEDSQDNHAEEIILTHLRHCEAVKKAATNIENALYSLDKKLSYEFIIFDLRSALDSLAEIIGIVTRDEILNNIFNKFCIGK